MGERLVTAKPEHEVAYQDLCELINKHADKVSPIELLAIGANMIGKLIAMQDQRKYSPGLIMHMVAKNIEKGNQETIEKFLNASGGTA